ncbi:EF-P beta-lysylation protein EpmB [Botrimarina sp.]|uniref:EF-P beta-lysylation protein EpmB n=1 Tax=Botrimarina sp. TaxID=2795802 RepID=UPI0032F07780
MPSLAHSESGVRPSQDEPGAARDGPGHGGGWQRELAQAIRDPVELCAALGLDPAIGRSAAEAGFSTLVPRPFLRRMRHGDPADPLLRQVLPSPLEQAADGLPADAVGDLASLRAPGLLQKYHGRALLMVSPRCAVHCRYCFRRHYPYQTTPASEPSWSAALDAIRADPTVSEVILSGGDPLTVGDGPLQRLFDRLETAPRVKRIRLHTRLPIVIPSRVTEGLAATIRGSSKRVVVVVHVNHGREIDCPTSDALHRLRGAGALLLNQAVLLRGVNDSVDTLADLSTTLVDAGVTPYYLHRLDRVAGVGHFGVAEGEGEALVQALRLRLPGYAVPRFVREDPGAPAKTVLA